MLWARTGELENRSEAMSSFVEMKTIFVLKSLGATIPDNLTLHLKMPRVKGIQDSMARSQNWEDAGGARVWISSGGGREGGRLTKPR